MRGDSAFLDTNVVAYLFSDNESEKQWRSFEVINEYDCHISTQVLNEFCNICTRKWKFNSQDIFQAIRQIGECCKLWTIDFDIISSAILLHDKYQYSFYDCLMISSALSCDCKYILTEDMSDGQIIEHKLTIMNIYA